MARILVVDDEPGIRELLSDILYDEGHAVELAENAGAARAARQRARPDLVLLDIWMPDSDGVSLLKEWRAERLLDMPVIMMSGHATIDTAIEATRIGAVAFLEKPITLARLLETVATALAQGYPPPGQAQRRAHPQTPPPQRPAIAPPPAAGGHDARGDILSDTIGHISLEQPLREARDAFERGYFAYHLKRERHNIARVAEKSGVDRTNLYRKLKQLGMASTKPMRRRSAAAPSDTPSDEQP